MRVVQICHDDSRPILRSSDVVVKERGSVNYLCAECGTLLIREATEHIPDAIIICPVCLALNEAEPGADAWVRSAVFAGFPAARI